jgi:hypothetical protein
MFSFTLNQCMQLDADFCLISALGKRSSARAYRSKPAAFSSSVSIPARSLKDVRI